MTDAEIIKALEWCLIGKGQCSECPLTNIPLSKCRISLYRDVLDLINRQQEEIDRLKFNLKLERLR